MGLLGNSRAIGDVFHITSDELLTWNQIHEIVAGAAGTTANIVHIPSDVIAAYDEGWGASLLGDKTHSMVFDNSKIKRTVPDFCRDDSVYPRCGRDHGLVRRRSGPSDCGREAGRADGSDPGGVGEDLALIGRNSSV